MCAASASAAMASPACQKLSSLSCILPDLPHLQHPRHTLLPFPASQQDPLPCTNYPQSFLLSPSPYVPFVRKVFEDAVCAQPVAPEQELESADNSTESSVSSCSMSSNSDDDEDDTGSSSTSSHSSSQLDDSTAHVEGPLNNLTSLCAALPIKRGLSRYFSGKSQSFSLLARVSSVADLAKPENPYVKRRRTGIGADSLLKHHHSYPPRGAGISKRATTSNRYKILKSLPRSDDAMLDAHAKLKSPRPSKCFSVPEF